MVIIGSFIVLKTILMAILAREQYRTRWPTDRISHVSSIEYSALLRYTVNMRCMPSRRTLGTDGLIRMVI